MCIRDSDYLEPFVHHGSRVYRDFGAHVPIGVFQCLRFGDGCQLLHGAGAERTSGGLSLIHIYPDHTCILPFPRLKGGPMDYTPGTVSYTHLEYFWYLQEFSADQVAWRSWHGGLWGWDEA